MSKKEDDTKSTGTGLTLESSFNRVEDLIGRRQLRRRERGEHEALLKFPLMRLSTPEAQVSLNLKNLPIAGVRDMYVVIGPYSFDEIKENLQAGFLRMSDQMLCGYDRWKTCKSYFPDLATEFSTNDITNTQTETSTASSPGAGFEEDVNAPKDTEELNISGEASGNRETLDLDSEESLDTGSLEMENMEVEDSPMESELEQNFFSSSTAATAKVGQNKVQSAKTTAYQAALPPISLGKKSSPLDTGKTPTTLVKRNSTPLLVLIFMLLGLGVLLVFLLKQRNSGPAIVENAPPLPLPLSPLNPEDPSKLPPSDVLSKSAVNEDIPGWPAELRPIKLADIAEKDDDSNSRKVRKVALEYQINAAQVFSQQDELFLRGQASPGGTSERAQVLAANHLAVHYLAQKAPVDAMRQLKNLVEDDSKDLSTLINYSVALYELSEFPEALNQVARAERFADKKNTGLFVNALHALLSASKEASPVRKEDIDRDFTSIERENVNNPIFYGLWARTLEKLKPLPKLEIQKLLQKALWADPDRVLDASYDAVPIARFWFVKEAFEGLKQAASGPDTKLKDGQKEFLDLMIERRGSGIRYEKLLKASVRDSLNRERVSDPLSQLLYAFMLKEEGKMKDASEVMSSLLGDPKENDFLRDSSYANTLAGEVSMYQGRFNEAKVAFSQALNHNNFDVTALWGLAVVAREQNQFDEALSKLAQAKAVDPSFYPALLRRERFSWKQSTLMGN